MTISNNGLNVQPIILPETRKIVERWFVGTQKDHAAYKSISDIKWTIFPIIQQLDLCLEQQNGE